MANDISGINSSRSQHTNDRGVTNKKSESSEASSRPSGNESSGRDKVSLTDTAARLKALEEQLAVQPEIDRDRVGDVQNAISNGKYKVDPERVADKMMNFEASFTKNN